jgi:hypothetical protein
VGLYTQQARHSQGLLGDGVDVRGEDGYVVVPPSSTLRAYRWVNRSPPRGGCLAARVPEGGELRRAPVLKSGPRLR